MASVSTAAGTSASSAVTPNAATPVTTTTTAATSTTSVQAAIAQTTTTTQSSSTAAATSAAASTATDTSRTASTAATSSATSSATTSHSTSTSSVASSTHASSSNSSSSSSSGSSSTSSSSTSALIANATGSTSNLNASSNPSLSNGAIGGIVGGAVGGLLIVALVFFLWRRNRNKTERVPPPPPRDMTYVTSTYHRNRQQSTLEQPGGNINRASSYSTLLAARPASTYQSHSRAQSAYYNTYPIATPSTDASPPMEPMEVESPPFTGPPSSGNTTPGSAGGRLSEKPVLAVNTGLHRDDSSSSSSDANAPPARRMPSIDRLRSEVGPAAGVGAATGDRATSPQYSFPPASDQGSSGPSSPRPSFHSHQHPSSAGYPSPSLNSHARMPSLSPNPDGRYPRPLSMASLSSSRYLHVGPAGGAPHQGRPINLEMPKLLGARPDSSGDFFNGMPRMEQGQMASFDSMPQMPAMYPAHSVPSKSYSERGEPTPVKQKRALMVDMVGEMGQQLPHPRRISSNQSITPKRSFTSSAPGAIPPVPPMPPMPEGPIAFPQPRRNTSSPSETSSQGSRSGNNTRRDRSDAPGPPRL